MRKALLLLAVVAALVSAGVAGAASVPTPQVACGPTCNGGSSGFTGCSSVTASRAANVGIVSLRHYLIVNYCKVNGIITSLSIAAHGCDANGLAGCWPGAAWQTGGGVGSGWATFEAHAQWIVYTAPFVSNTDVLYLTVPAG